MTIYIGKNAERIDTKILVTSLDDRCGFVCVFPALFLFYNEQSLCYNQRENVIGKKCKETSKSTWRPKEKEKASPFHIK